MKWEYLYTHIPTWTDARRLTEALNNYGEQGWELVSFDFVSNTNMATRVVFKRPVEAE